MVRRRSIRYRTSISIKLGGLGTIIKWSGAYAVLLRVSVYVYVYIYIYIYIYIYMYIYIYITWNNRLHVADGPSFPGRIVGRPCLLAGYPSARDFRLASLILDNANLVVISDKPEKNPGEGHFAGYFPEFIRRLPTVTLEDTSPSVVAREDGLTEDRFKADDAHDIRNVISFRKKRSFSQIDLT